MEHQGDRLPACRSAARDLLTGEAAGGTRCPGFAILPAVRCRPTLSAFWLLSRRPRPSPDGCGPGNLGVQRSYGLAARENIGRIRVASPSSLQVFPRKSPPESQLKRRRRLFMLIASQSNLWTDGNDRRALPRRLPLHHCHALAVRRRTLSLREGSTDSVGLRRCRRQRSNVRSCLCHSLTDFLGTMISTIYRPSNYAVWVCNG
jgi:hypothetical protein